MVKKVIFVILFVSIFQSSAQEHPPILNFAPRDYNAHNQNWDIDQDDRGVMYFANNAGLLQYNGAHWQLYTMPNSTIVRSVLHFDDRIYTGSYMDFGYWLSTSTGTLEYHSLIKELNINIQEDEEFWNIEELDGYLIFQSRSRIYLLNSESGEVKTINSTGTITKMTRFQDRIYFQRLGQGLFQIENGEELLINDSNLLKSNPIVGMFSFEDTPYILTESEGLYSLENNNLTASSMNNAEEFRRLNVYSAILVNDNLLMLGSISNGLLQIDLKTEQIVRNFNQSNGLSNNTVLSLFQDTQDNIWMGLDYGINAITINSDLLIYRDKIGKLGTVYTSLLSIDTLYLGTNQGLFYKKKDDGSEFKLVDGSEGQVWMLKEIDGTIFCGHNEGTLIIESGQIKSKILEAEGSWDYRRVPGRNNLLLQGNYDGLYILEKQEGEWVMRNKIKGFDISSRFFEFFNDQLFVNHEFKGLFQLDYDDDLNSFSQVQKIDDVGAESGSSIFLFADDLFYSSTNNIWKFEPADGFQKNDAFTGLFSSFTEMSSLFRVNESDNLIWRFADDDLLIIEPGTINADPKMRTLPLSSENRETVAGFGNLTKLQDNSFLIGTSGGYLIINANQIEEVEIPEIQINSITSNSLNGISEQVDLSQPGNFANKRNNFHFSYNIPSYQLNIPTEYQFKLEGYHDKWSSWEQSSEQYFENLPHGSYNFQVRGRIGNVISPNVASFAFEIEKPFSLSNEMITVYALLVTALLIGLHFIYRGYYKRQRAQILLASKKELHLKELENEQARIKFENEKLEQDIVGKNRELAISTMSLIKKNEFLNSLKLLLKKAQTSDDYRNVIRTIDKNLNNQDDWKFFEEAFNNADKGFLKKIKSKHPNLTHNDLKLCAYLRLNLSSKEIAPLLNISSRSVEVKRYRLRKKMNLSHEKNLTEHILEV